MLSKKIYISLLFIITSLPVATLAYTDTPIQGSMILDVTPANPAPGGTVSIRATSYSADLNRSSIVWSGNGATFAQGVGLRTIAVKLGPAGSQTTIRVSAHTPEGDSIIEDLGFRPAGVDLLWQAHTSVPSYYAGRALPVAGSSVTVVAEPNFIGSNGQRIDQANLSYVWTRNGNKLEDASGFGKYSLDVADISEFTPEIIGVTVTDVSGLIVAESSVTIPILTPRVAVYEEDPLQGTKFGAAITDFFNLLTEEVTLRGEPYFYPRSSTPVQTWTVNGQITSADSDNPSLITLREQANQSGIAAITYEVNNGNERQSAHVPFSIRFGASQIKF